MLCKRVQMAVKNQLTICPGRTEGSRLVFVEVDTQAERLAILERNHGSHQRRQTGREGGHHEHAVRGVLDGSHLFFGSNHDPGSEGASFFFAS